MSCVGEYEAALRPRAENVCLDLEGLESYSGFYLLVTVPSGKSFHPSESRFSHLENRLPEALSEMNKRACAVYIKEGHAVGIQMLPSLKIYFLNLSSWVQWTVQPMAAASL